MIDQIVLDLDGLLVDFHLAALRHHNISDTLEDFYSKYLGEYMIPTITGMSWDAFFVGMGYDFWSNLDWTKEGKVLIEALELRYGRSRIALWSSPSDNLGCCDGKRAWVRKHLPLHYYRHLVLGGIKHLASNPNTILIDDYDVNIDAFVRPRPKFQPGHGILFPRLWNRNHYRRHDALEFTFNSLDQIERYYKH